jgi:hypothetical protein
MFGPDAGVGNGAGERGMKIAAMGKQTRCAKSAFRRLPKIMSISPVRHSLLFQDRG